MFRPQPKWTEGIADAAQTGDVVQAKALGVFLHGGKVAGVVLYGDDGALGCHQRGLHGDAGGPHGENGVPQFHLELG